MLLTIVAIWAIVIPLAVLGVSWKAADMRDVRAAEAATRSLHNRLVSADGNPRCAVPATRPRRTITRRACHERPRGVGRRSASA